MKQEQSAWKAWGDHPFVALAQVAAALLAIFVYATGKPFLPDLVPATPAYVAALRDRSTYLDAAGRFSIDYPNTWHCDDQSTPKAVRVRFSAENNDSALMVLLFEWPDKLRDTQLEDILAQHVQKSFGQYNQFSQMKADRQLDGSLEIVGAYDAQRSDGEITRMQINSYIEQSGGLISIITIVVGEDQFGALSEPIAEILNSFHIGSPAPVAPSPPGRPKDNRR